MPSLSLMSNRFVARILVCAISIKAVFRHRKRNTAFYDLNNFHVRFHCLGLAAFGKTRVFEKRDVVSWVLYGFVLVHKAEISS